MRYARISNGQIVEAQIVGHHYGKPLKHDGMTYTNPAPQDYAAAGWLLEIIPIPTETQKIGNLVVNQNNYTWEVIDKTPEELQAEAGAQAEADELASEIAASPLDGITFTQAAAYIEDNVVDLPSAKIVLKKLAKAILILNKQLHI